MPAIALAVFAYAVGLALELGGFVVWGTLIAVCIATAGVLAHQWVPAALGALLAGGLLAAWSSERREEHCRAVLVTGVTWRITLQDAAAPGAYVRGQAARAGCVADVWLAVERGHASAGSTMLTRGTVIPAGRAMKIAHASLVSPVDGPLLAGVRARLGIRIDTLFGADAPLVRALLIADTRELDPAVRDRYAQAGIVHILSISGLHVAIIAMAVELVARACRLPSAVAGIGALTITALYVAVIGAPPPALRSGVMLAVATLSRHWQRPTSPWAALALGAVVPLAEPRTVLDVGYQLSVGGMAALIASGALARRWIAPHLSGHRAALARGLLASTVASLASAPLVAWTFGRISLVAPLTNLAAAPLIGLVQPALFLVMVVAPIAPLARLLAGGVHPLLRTLDLVASAGAATPYGWIAVSPTLGEAVCGGVAAAALIAASASAFPGRALIAGAVALAGMVWLPLVPLIRSDNRFELHLIDVGQGDAIALRTPAGRWVLVDSGRNWPGGDAARSTVIPYLRRRGGAVAAFVLSHPHADHVGGAATLFEALRPTDFWDGAYAGGSQPYRDALAVAAREGIHWHRVHPGDSLTVDGVVLTMLAPDSAWMRGIHDPNLASVILMARYGTTRFLMVGDAEAEEERWLIAHATAALRADVLKVAHHGSSTSSSVSFLAAVRPRLALISVGAGNSYHHPSSAVVRALVGVGAVVLRTDADGTIVVRSDGAHIEVEEGGDRWQLAP